MYEDEITIDLSQYPERMDTEQVAEALNLTREALDNHLSRRTIIIPFVKVGKAREFHKKHVEAYLQARYEAAAKQANQQLDKAS